MRLVLSHIERGHAERLIRQTCADGADATATALDSFPEDAYPALIAYLAYVACDARGLPKLDSGRYQHDLPDRFTDAQRRHAHNRYTRGDRSPDVVTAEREYQRVWKRNHQPSKAKVDGRTGKMRNESGPESAGTDRGLRPLPAKAE